MIKKCNKCEELKQETEFELTYFKEGCRRKTCKKCRNLARNKLNTRHGTGLKNARLIYLYGITSEDYYTLSAKQNDKCCICNEINKFGPWKEKLVVDHCHTTGKVRGLLCDKCNKGLGQFNDNPELLQKAFEYLKKFKD